MPSKSRTSKNKSKKSKLKWWYAVPIVIVMAITGYFIVRLSFASNSEVVYEFSCRTAFSVNSQDRWAFAFRGYRRDSNTKSVYVTTKEDGTGAKSREFIFADSNEKEFRMAIDVSEANLNKELYIFVDTTEGSKSIGSQVPNSLEECN